MNQMQSSSRKTMRKRSGKYLPDNMPLRKLNVTSPKLRVKSTNNMKTKSRKSFKPKVRASRVPTNQSSKAVAKATSGRPGAARSIKAGVSRMVDISRVDQISPAQFGKKAGPTSKTVSSNPRKQNKKPSLNAFSKSIRRSMGYT